MNLSKIICMKNYVKKSYLLFFVFVAITTQSIAVRPFVTDDATLIGFRRAEVANWFYVTGETAEIWHSFNYGITHWLEMNLIGFQGLQRGYVPGVDGAEGNYRWRYSWTAPLIQAKFLIRNFEPNSWPGVTFAIGSDLPFGNRPFRTSEDDGPAFRAPRPGGLGFFSFTQAIGMEEQLLLHASVGATWMDNNPDGDDWGLIWGIGTQFTTGLRDLYGIAEFISGDPYIRGQGGFAWQLGARYFISDDFQFDIGFGSGLGGDNDLREGWWLTGGFRWVLNFDRGNRHQFSRQGRIVQ